MLYRLPNVPETRLGDKKGGSIFTKIDFLREVQGRSVFDFGRDLRNDEI